MKENMEENMEEKCSKIPPLIEDVYAPHPRFKTYKGAVKLELDQNVRNWKS